MASPTFNIFRGARPLVASFSMVLLLIVGGCSNGSDSSAANPEPEYGPDSPVTDPKAIAALAEAAYIWSLPLEFTYRFGKYNELMTGDVNTLAYVPAPAAWNNAATNAGNASVLYINGILDLTGETAIVYTLPNPSNVYTVTQFLDSFINTFANPGSRTTTNASDPTHYLLVGPDSQYARSQTATIDGQTFPVIASDTSRAQLLVRVLASTLAPALDADSTYNALINVAYEIRLNTLEEFLEYGAIPPKNGFAIKTPTDEERTEAETFFQNTPDNALDFFSQVGTWLQINKLPERSTGLGGTPIASLPSYIVQQPDANSVYYPPSAEQQLALASFGPIGLSQTGFKIPGNWGSEQLSALQEGWTNGVEFIQARLGRSATADTNWWIYINAGWGTYPNDVNGYITRAVGVISGGFPSLVNDGLYAAQFLEGGTDVPLRGDNVYTLTFSATNASTLPPAGQEIGNQPPLMLKADQSEVGFWSVTIYQPGKGEAVCPCVPQVGVLNTYYSETTTSVTHVDPATSTITAEVPFGASFSASSPVLFGNTASEYGLEPNVAYYLIKDPDTNSDGTVSFQLSDKWLQRLSTAEGDPGTPVQFSGQAGSMVTLKAGLSPLQYGFVKPVVQLGSSEINKDMLTKNLDDTYTIWFAPTLPEGAYPSNWIPTPSTDYYKNIYPDASVLNTNFWPIFRIYAPTEGNDTPSILPCTDCDWYETVGGEQTDIKTDNDLLATYRFPMIIRKP